MSVMSEYGIETTDSPADLGVPATLTVILRDLDRDTRTHAFVPVELAEAGDDQRGAIVRAMAGRFPDARFKTYRDDGVASFLGRRHLYIVVYETHDVDDVADAPPPRLFAV